MNSIYRAYVIKMKVISQIYLILHVKIYMYRI